MKAIKRQLLDSLGRPMKNVHTTTDSRMVHTEVYKIAKEMTGIYYERTAGLKDGWYKMFPDVDDFCDHHWQNFVFLARQYLASQLTNPNHSENAKQRFYEILLDDATLPYSPKETQIINVH